MIFKECPDCGGDGRIEKTVPVRDFDRGGYLKGVMADCDYCNGLGEVMFDDLEEEDQ